MEIELADQHVYELDQRLTVEEIRQRAVKVARLAIDQQHGSET